MRAAQTSTLNSPPTSNPVGWRYASARSKLVSCIMAAHLPSRRDGSMTVRAYVSSRSEYLQCVQNAHQDADLVRSF
jgi:hypothetical protein